MSKFTSRKVVMFVINTLLFAAGFFAPVLLGATAQVAELFTIYTAAQICISFAFVGGLVWSSYIKSKYYRPELDDRLMNTTSTEDPSWKVTTTEAVVK